VVYKDIHALLRSNVLERTNGKTVSSKGNSPIKWGVVLFDSFIEDSFLKT